MTAAKEASMQLTTSPEVLCEVEPQIYRAGVPVAIKPGKLPSGLVYEEFRGGKYFRFILTGSYSNLPNAAAEFSRSFPMATSRFAMISISKTMSMTREQHRRISSSQKSCSQARKRQNPTCVR
jgi:hypothetical protein